MSNFSLQKYNFRNFMGAVNIRINDSMPVPTTYIDELSAGGSQNIYLTNAHFNFFLIPEDECDTVYMNENISGIARELTALKHTDFLKSSICNYTYVNNMHTAYANCFKLKGSPKSGNSVKSMYGTYFNDHNLTGSYKIGKLVNNLIGTYYNCYNLTDLQILNTNATMMVSTFYNCTNLIGSPIDADWAKSLKQCYYNCILLEGKPGNCNNAFITTEAYYNCPNLYGDFYWGYNKGTQASIVNAENMFYGRNYDNKLNIYIHPGSILNALVNYADSYGSIYGETSVEWLLLQDAQQKYYYNNATTNTNLYIVLETPVILGHSIDGLVANIKFKIPKTQDYTRIWLVGNKDTIPTEPFGDNEVTVPLRKTDKSKEVDLEYENSDYWFIIYAETPYGITTSPAYRLHTSTGRYKALYSSDIAIRHTNDNQDGEIWLAYIKEEDMIIHVKHTLDTPTYNWTEEVIPIVPIPTGIKCDMAFDSYIKYNGDTAEFITEPKPCIAYITAEGACNLLDLNTGAIQTIAAENVVDVSLVRSPVIGEGQTDYGFTVFFIAGGKAYYRQRINSIWYDAEVISVADNNKTYVAIEAFCTWDYRTGVQITDEDGNLYQFITYPEGILNQEHHIEFNGISASSTLTWGWSAVPVLVENIEDSGNWGTTIRVTFDWPNTESGLSPTMFTLVDDNGINYVCQSCSLNGIYLTLTFDDFNLAGKANDVTLTYTKPSNGGLISPAVQTDSFSETFVPVNLDPPQIDPPTFLSASNSDVMTIDLVLTETMLNTEVSSMLSHFTITWQEYDWTPGGALHTETRTLATLTKINDTILRMVINKPSFTSVIGDITISYDGQGGLRGLGGPASAFENSFTPTGLTWKGHQNEEEHIEFTNITANIDLHTIIYTDVKSSDEHIAFADIETNINLHSIVYSDAKSSNEHIAFNDISATIELTEIHPI